MFMLKNLLDCFIHWKLEQNLITEEKQSNECFNGSNVFLEKDIKFPSICSNI